MIELWQGINNYFTVSVDTATLRTLLTGGLHNLEAPENVSYPYAVFQMISIVPDNHASSKRYVENCLVQFNLFSDQPSMAALLAIYDELTTQFDFCQNLSVTNYTVLSCVREGGTEQPSMVEGVWQLNINYRIKLKP